LPPQTTLLGRIRRHTIVSSLIIYLGFLIGAFNLLILYPRFIPVEYMGLTKVVMDYSVILTSFASLGFIAPFFRFQPYYTQYTAPDKNDLFQLYLVVVHAGMVGVTLLSMVSEKLITGYFNARSPLFSDYYYSTLVFGYLLLLYNVFEMYLFSKGEAIFQSFVREIVIRLIILMMVLGVIWGLSMKGFVSLYSIHYLIPLLLLVYYARRKHPFALGLRFSKTSLRLLPHMAGMAGIGFVQNIINAGVPVIDTLVVGGLVGLEGVATYLLMNYISTLVHVPVRATASVLGAKISAHWKDNEVDKIQALYHRTSMSYLIFSFFMVSLILFNLDLFQRLIGKNITISMAVIIPLVLSKIMELSTGLSNLIIGYSKKWKIESTISVTNVILAIPLNIVMVGRFGILGAAWSTLILATLSFTVRILVLYRIYRLWPFQWSTLGFIGIGLALFAGFYLLCGWTPNLFMKIAWSILYALIFITIVLWFRFSEDLNIVFETIRTSWMSWYK